MQTGGLFVFNAKFGRISIFCLIFSQNRCKFYVSVFIAVMTPVQGDVMYDFRQTGKDACGFLSL